MGLFKYGVNVIYEKIVKHRRKCYVFIYIIFVALLTQFIINIVDSVQQFKDQFSDLEAPVTTEERIRSQNVPPPGTQMGQKQIENILKVLPKTGNLLVWGLGFDSPFWHKRTSGKVIFIETAGKWHDVITGVYPYLEVYKVAYTTHLVESFYKYLYHPEIWSDLDLRPQLPKAITSRHWHVIVIDGPMGFGNGPGRYQSIYTSSLLAQKGTHIFVDDFERRVEHEYSIKMLGQPVDIVKRPAVLGLVGENLQAHFLR